jgi:hypothetical protein
MKRIKLAIPLLYLFFGIFLLPHCGKEEKKPAPVEPKKFSVLMPPDLLSKKKKTDKPKEQARSRPHGLVTRPAADQTPTRPKEQATLLSKVKSLLEGPTNTQASVEVLRVASPEQTPIPDIKGDEQLLLTVKNETGKNVIVSCFYYTKLRLISYWRWNKSPIYTLKQNESITIPIAAAADKETKENIYAYLGVFNSMKEAEDSTFELLTEEQKIDLDRVAELQDSTVSLIVHRYGFKEETIDYRLKSPEQKPIRQPELDFLVENKTDKPLLITCFVYEKESDQDSFVSWKYQKTPVQRVEPNAIVAVDIETIRELYDWIYMRGFLAVFDENRVAEAQDATYELLTPEQKLNIGRLADLLGKKVVVGVQKYGIAGNIMDFQPQPIRRIDFDKNHKKPRRRPTF